MTNTQYLYFWHNPSIYRSTVDLTIEEEAHIVDHLYKSVQIILMFSTERTSHGELPSRKPCLFTFLNLAECYEN